MRLRVLALALALTGLAVMPAQAQEPKKPVEVFREIRDLINTGRFDIAAETIKDFLAIPPTEQDYLDIEARFGSTAILRLAQIPRWYDNNARNAEFVEREDPNVPGSKNGPLQTLIKGSLDANAKLLKDPRRVARFVNNLGQTREEYIFAVQELRRSGDFVVPIMVETLRTDTNPELRRGILSAVRELGPETIPGFRASVDGLDGDLKIGMLQAIAGRADIVRLMNFVDTDITPYLWYYASDNKDPSVKSAAAMILRSLTGGSLDQRQPSAELVAVARRLYDRKADFAALDRATNRVTYWLWDADAGTVASHNLSLANAQERLGLKYLTWAVERDPGNASAEQLFIALATERAMERANFGNFAKGDPVVYRVVAAAPSSMILELLNAAMVEKKTALVLGLVQVLGDRAEIQAAYPIERTGPDGTPIRRPAPLVQALNYPDPRVQYAAAVAILKSRRSADTGANARIVEILARTVAGVGNAGTSAKRVLIADPKLARADQTANLLRAMGYVTEQFGTGRDLMTRIRQASDFDLVVLDRHVGQPELRDLLAQLKVDTNFARRPVLVVASLDQEQPPGVEQLLVRLAALVAASETEDIQIPESDQVDRRKTEDEVQDLKRENAAVRDRYFQNLFQVRLDRLTRLVEASRLVTELQIDDRIDLRLLQLTYAAIIAEYAPPQNTAPMLYKNYDQVLRRIQALGNLDQEFDRKPPLPLINIVQRMEQSLTPDLIKRFESIRARMDLDTLLVTVESDRDLAMERALNQMVSTLPSTFVIPQPYSKIGLEHHLKTLLQDPADLPRAPEEKLQSAKEAIGWLARLGTGEVAGYDIQPAASAISSALQVQELAPDAVTALAQIPSREAQIDLLRVVLNGNRPESIRTHAAEALIRHIQTHGKLVTADLAPQVPQAVTPDISSTLRGELEIIQALLSGQAGELSQRIQEFRLPLPGAGAAPAAPKAENGAKEPEKNEN